MYDGSKYCCFETGNKTINDRCGYDTCKLFLNYVDQYTYITSYQEWNNLYYHLIYYHHILTILQSILSRIYIINIDIGSGYIKLGGKKCETFQFTHI